jgi:hypothetical protein
MEDDARLSTTDSILYESLGESLGLKDWCKLLGLTREDGDSEPKQQRQRPRKDRRKGG